MKRDSVDYYRARAGDELKAARNAACPKARQGHEELANAYERLLEIADLEQRGELPEGKVTSLADAARDREQSEVGGHAPKRP